MKPYHYLPALLFSISGHAVASNVTPPVFEFGYANYGTADVDEPGANTEITLEEFTLSSTFFAKDFAEGKLVLSTDYKHSSFTSKSTAPDSSAKRSNHVHNASLIARYIKQQNEWRHIITLAPGIYSDLKSLDGDDLDMSASYTALQTLTSDLQWLMGFGYSRSFGDPSGFPIMGVNYTPNDDWQFKLGFPHTAIHYAPSDTLYTYFTLQPGGGKWNLEVDGNDDVNITYKSFEMLLGIESKISDSLWLSVEAGRVFGRNFEISDTTNNTLGDVDIDASNVIAINLRIRR